MNIDWSRAPDWANWWACDASGDAYWYEGKPQRQHPIWRTDSDISRIELAERLPPPPDWRQECYQRPVEENTDMPKDEWIEAYNQEVRIMNERRGQREAGFAGFKDSPQVGEVKPDYPETGLLFERIQEGHAALMNTLNRLEERLRPALADAEGPCQTQPPPLRTRRPTALLRELDDSVTQLEVLCAKADALLARIVL